EAVARATAEAVAKRKAEEAADEAQRRTAAERWERYRSNIAAASSALHLNSGDTARRALDEAPREHRNWEWRHLAGQLDTSRTVLRLPRGSVLAFSPRANRLATVVLGHNTIRLWDVAAGKEVAVLRGHDAKVTPRALVFSPDGTRLASGSADG